MDGRVEFSREVPHVDPREIWADGQKWKDFFMLLEKAKHEGASTLVIDRPEALGDTWREVILNLSAVGSAGLTLEIKDATGVVKAELDCSSGIERDLGEHAVFERKSPLLSNVAAALVRAEQDRKFGPYILRVGKEPPVLLHSSGPDPVYCQAELLLMAEWEDFKPSGKGREVQGSYELTAGTVEWFLSKYADKPSHGVIEEYRRKILDQGFMKFTVPRGQAVQAAFLAKTLKGELKRATPETLAMNQAMVRKTKETIEKLERP